MSANGELTVELLRSRVATLRQRIADAGGGAVELVAVTKSFDRRVVDLALAAGLRDLGENYAQELVRKVDEAPPGAPQPTWHFIGVLQRNKVRILAPHVALWQSVDRPELGREIAKRAPGAAVLVQVNISGEEHKGGCDPAAAPALVSSLRTAGLDVRGLMGVGPAGEPEAARVPFRRLVGLAGDLGLPVRSIGMTADLEVAVEEGSTMVRVGRELFGARPPR